LFSYIIFLELLWVMLAGCTWENILGIAAAGFY